MLDPSKLSSFPNYDDQKSFHGRLTRVAKLKSAKKDAAVASLYSAFRALALSNCHPILADFMSHFYPSFLQYYLGSKRDFKNPDQLKMAYVDFPICVLMLHTDDFNSKILPIISNEKKPDYWQYFAKLVRRVCKQSQSKISNLDFLDALIDPVMSIFKRAEKNQTAAQCIVHIMSGFQYSPYFFRMVLAKQPENIDLIINRIKADESLTPQYALLNLFDPKDIEIADFSGNIEIITKLLQFLTETYQKITLYKTNTFADSIPNVILQIAEFLHLYFQSNNNNIEPDIISYLESSAIMFLASSQKELRLYGVSIISSILEIVHNIESIDFPIDSYQKLLFEARRTPILTTAHNSIKNGLREIPKATKGISKSFETLFPYFLALTKAINPNIELIKQPENVLQPKDYDLQEEWVGTTSIMLSITFNEIQDIISQIRILLNDDGDLGACVVSAIPTAINIKHFNFIIQNANEWLSLLHDENNYFEVNSKNMNFIANLMKMLRGLTDQKQWKPNNINEEHFSNIMSTIVSYCDLIPGETLRLSCVQCLISMITLLNTHKKKIQSVIRHQTGKTLLGWIPTTKDTENLSKQYISKIHQALSLLLDDLNLLDCIDPNDPNTPEEQATEQFMLYFASIKNRLDSTETDESDMIPVLASLLKQNLSIGIEHCISMGFAENDNVRAVFIAALAAVFKVPDVKVVENEKTSDTLIDTIFTGDWSFVEYVCSCIPYSRAEAFGAAMVESAMLRGIEYEYLEKMISVEVETCDEASKNTLFRGNAVPARAVGHFPRLVGTQWMTQTLRPVFEKVITNCDKGIRYEVNPAKIGDGNLEQNQENFRNLLNEFIQVILAAREKMPPSLVIESKLIYKKVSEKYGDFAIQILSGFLFLRFLLPAFNVPKLVGLPEMLPAIPRAALLSISTVLMAATLRGRLNEKGQFYIPFNDVAQYANDSFREMFLQIVETEVNEQPKEDEVLKTLNEETEINVLHAELYSVLPQLTNGITEMEEDNPVRVQTESLIAKIHSMGEPTNKKQNKKQTILEEESSASGSNQGQKQLEQLLTMEFTEDQIQEIHDFIIHDKNNAPDGSSIYYVYFEKLKNIKDIRIVPYIYIKTIHDDPNNSIIMVNILNDFDESKIPTPNEISIFAKMNPMKKVKHHICIQTSTSFINWLSNTPQVLANDQNNRFIFVKQLSDYTDILGAPSKILSSKALESLTRPDSVHKAIINGQNGHVRIHQHSIQIENEEVTIKQFKLLPLRVILAKEIQSYSKPIPTSPENIDFTLSTSDMVYLITVNKTSTLLDNIGQLYKRDMTLNNLNNSSMVKIDTSTLQWLMLNLAFINLMNDNVKPIVLRSAVDLLYVTYNSFQFNRKLNVSKVSLNALPSNLVSYAQSLSEDLALNNPDQFNDFMNEYFKALQYIDKLKSKTFIYLSSWIPLYAKSIDKYPNFTDKIIDTFLELSNDSFAFTKSIWPGIIANKHATEIYMWKIYKIRKASLIGIITGFASLNSSIVSEFWSKIIFEEAFKKYDENDLLFICKILTVLLSHHLFDMEFIPYLIYNLAQARIHYSNTILTKCALAYTNTIHLIICKSGISKVSVDYVKLTKKFSCVLDQNKDNLLQTKWIESTQIIANVLGQELSTLDKKELHEKTFEMFYNDLQCENITQRAQSIIFSAAFLNDNKVNKFITQLTSMSNANDPFLTNAICIALSLINIPKEYTSKLFIFGVVLSLTFLTPTAVQLIASSLINYSKYDDVNNITNSLPKEALDYLSECTSLPFNEDLIYSALIICATHCNKNIINLAKALEDSNINNPIAKVFKLLITDKYLNDDSIYDFGPKNASVNAALFLILRETHTEQLIQYLIRRIDEDPEGFQSFRIFNSGRLSQNTLNISDPKFLFKVVRASMYVSEKYQLEPILLPFYNKGMEMVQLNNEQFDYLSSVIFN